MPTDIPLVVRCVVTPSRKSLEALPTGLVLTIFGLGMAILNIGLDDQWAARQDDAPDSLTAWSRARFEATEMRPTDREVISQERLHVWWRPGDSVEGGGGRLSTKTPPRVPEWRGKVRA